MADTKSAVIRIQTLEAVRNVKELKDNIAALKKRIDDVNTSTDEYADLTKQLQQNQAALRNVMNGTNSTFQESITAAQGLDTSYNSLVEQLKEATQEWRAIPKYLSEVDAQQNKVSQAWADASAKVLNLRTQLKSMDEGTGSYVRNVGNYKSALEGFSGAMNTAKQVGGDMVNGLSAAASTLALMGIQTDGLTDSMKNLRIVVAALQGAKCFAGMIQNLVSYFKAGKNATAATKAQTTALQGEAAAQNAANTATAAGSVALGTLQKALIATGIGALVVGLGMLVAHFEDVVKWIGKVGEKLGIVSKQTKVWEGANDKLSEKFGEQNRQLELQQKIYAAQGKSKKQLLLQQKAQIELQIAETEATIKTIEARIKEMEADSAWVRFWKGENAQIKKAKEEVEALTASLKEMNQTKDSINIDIQVEEIEAGKNAAVAAKKEADELAKKAQEIIKTGSEEAKAAIKAEMTETEKLDSEFAESAKKIQDAIDKMRELSGETADVKELEEGLIKAKTKYYKNRFEANAAENAKETAENLEKQYKSEEEYERIYKEVLGFDRISAYQSGRATAEEEKKLEILRKQLEYLKEQTGYSDDVLKNLTLTAMTKEEFDAIGEPMATALKLYFEKSDEFREVGLGIAQKVISDFEGEFNKQLENRNYAGAAVVADKLMITMFTRFEELEPYFEDYYDKILRLTNAKAILEDEYGFGTGIVDIIAPKSDIEKLKERISEINKQIEEHNGVEGILQREIAALEEQILKKRMERFSIFYTQLGKYINTYGMAVGNVMGSVADAWEAALQAQVKSGRKSEEEAKRSFENVKALQIGVAVINTAAAITSALADPTIPSYFVKAANAVAALASGTAQVIKISQTEFNSNVASATENTPTLVDRTPPLQYTIGLNSEEYAAAMAETPIRAYVVDADLSNGLNQYNRRRGETTF